MACPATNKSSMASNAPNRNGQIVWVPVVIAGAAQARMDAHWDEARCVEARQKVRQLLER